MKRPGRTRAGVPRSTLPPAPAGQVLKGARRAFRTTHDTRPALSEPVPGTITGALSGSTGHSAEPAASAQDGAPGSVTSLAPAGSGTDSPRIRSGEATAAHRPQLVLTFGVE